jgi:hypothetical protein
MAVPAAGGYGYAEPTGPRGGRGGRGPGGDKAGGDKEGGGRPGGNNVALWAALAVLIVLVFCVGGGWLLLRTGGNRPSGTGPLATTAPVTQAPTATSRPTRPRATTTTTAATPKSHLLICEEAQNQDADVVRKKLEDSNYIVKIITDQPGGRKGRVAAMSPCGRQPEGTEVTLWVFMGEGRAAPNP